MRSRPTRRRRCSPGMRWSAPRALPATWSTGCSTRPTKRPPAPGSQRPCPAPHARSFRWGWMPLPSPPTRRGARPGAPGTASPTARWWRSSSAGSACMPRHTPMPPSPRSRRRRGSCPSRRATSCSASSPRPPSARHSARWQPRWRPACAPPSSSIPTTRRGAMRWPAPTSSCRWPTACRRPSASPPSRRWRPACRSWSPIGTATRTPSATASRDSGSPP